MASKLLTLCARILRPVMEEAVRQQRAEEKARLAAMTPADIQAEVETYIRSVMPIFNQVERTKESMH